jgi:hypothetical protein
MKLPRRTFVHLAAGTAALPIASPVAVLGQGTITPTGAIRIVERLPNSSSSSPRRASAILICSLARLSKRSFRCATLQTWRLGSGSDQQSYGSFKTEISADLGSPS